MANRFLAPLILRILGWDQVDRVCRNLDDRIREIVKVPLVDGILIADIDATTGGLEVVHGLGRTPLGATVVRADTAATYVLDSFNASTFKITASAASTVNLWVF